MTKLQIIKRIGGAAVRGIITMVLITLIVTALSEFIKVTEIHYLRVIVIGGAIAVAAEIESLIKYASNRRELYNGGDVLIDDFVQLKFKKKSRTGWLFLRVEELTFIHKTWFGYFERIDIKREDIIFYEARNGFDGYGVLPRYIRIKTRNGEIYDVYVHHRGKWIETFALKEHSVES